MNRNATHAFTLIELILVMGLLALVLAISAPALSGFVKGRALTEESRRFLALTRYGRSEAASRAVPMELWIEPEQGTYGIGPAAGFESVGGESLDYRVGEGLRLEVQREAADENGRATIVFQPDGAVGEGSVETLTIAEGASHSVTIARAESGMGYRIQDASHEE
ncbi:GspH/FimT family pseudopilin [Candidatus Sumerlaeota bacterium]|nr:GspH/FimT family pseudopilin [Candidatus Sumerlaeota bacterium]